MIRRSFAFTAGQDTDLFRRVQRAGFRLRWVARAAVDETIPAARTKLDPPQGFSAQTACAAILWTTAHYGFPVSTTHTITGSVMGAVTFITLCTTAISLVPSFLAARMKPVTAMHHIG